jgi:hypothetical protein
MSDLSEKILNILLDEGINKEDISSTLFNIQSEIETKLWEKINVSPLIFFKLKDTIFYNFEYCNYNDKPTGKTTLKDFGRNYPILMFNFNASTYVLKEDVELLLKEIEDIRSKWNQNICIANIYTKSNFSWNVGDENPSSLIIYNEENETPMTHGYYNNSYSNIFDSSGQKIKHEEEIVLCAIQKIGIYSEYNLLTQLLDNLYNVINEAQKNQKGLCIDLDNYNYE